MSLPQSITSFCLFCYKSIGLGENVKDNLLEIKQFHTFLSRFVCNETIQNQFTINTSYANGLLNCCQECETVIVSFCDLYNQIKCLELQLDAKLDKIVRKVELSNKVPSRLMNVQIALKLTSQDDLDKIHESRDRIIKIRQDVINSGLQRTSKSYPRVLVERLDQEKFNSVVNGASFSANILPQETVDPPIFNAAKQEDNSMNSFDDTIDSTAEESWDNETNSALEDYPLVEVKQEYPQSPSSEPDNDIITPETTLPSPPKSNVPRKFPYVSCEICGKKVAAMLKSKHYRMSHDLNKVSYESQIFRCESKECTAYFLTNRQLKKHNSEIHAPKKRTFKVPSPEYLEGVEYFRCEICKTPFDSVQTFKRHMSSALCEPENGSTSANIECWECKENFETKSNLWMHQYKVHTTDKKTVCPKCGKFFREKRRFNSHMEYHKGPGQWKWECKECGKRSATRYQIKRHISTHKKDDDDWDENDLIIEHDKNNEMEEEGALPELMDDGNGSSKFAEQNDEPSLTTVSDGKINCVCALCGKRFLEGQYLKKHMLRVHSYTNGLKWQCGKCGKKFVNKWNMISHMKFHKVDIKSKVKTGRRMFQRKPKLVMKKFNLSENSLEVDIKIEPLSEDGSIYQPRPTEQLRSDISNSVSVDQVQCKECDKLLGSEKLLWIHQIKAHKKNVCKLCGKEFRLRAGLNLHLEYHKDPQEWKWECGECGKKCATKQKLKEHSKSHTGIKTHSCHLCESGFGFSHNLKRHLKDKHGVVVEVKPKVPKYKTSSRVTCKYCQGEFAHSASLKRHCKSMHKEILEVKAEKNDMLAEGDLEDAEAEEILP